MKIETFIQDFRNAFGEAAELPILFWYSETPVNVVAKIGGCFFKGLREVRNGSPISLNAENIGCGGGKFYTGFTEMPERIPNFVSLTEKYKETPELVREFLRNLNWTGTSHAYLNFARIDQTADFSHAEGLLFFATPDELSGLTSWTFFDTNAPDAVTTLFGSGCSSIVTQTVIENQQNGKRTFLGLFDPSVRPYIEADRLSFVIPMSRFREMYATLSACCLANTPAWQKVRARINRTEE